jgi:hypothetical protein
VIAVPGQAARTWWTRLLVSFGAGLGAAVLVALGLTVWDLYRAGHGIPPLGRPWLEVEQWGIHLSRADVVFLAAAVLGAGLTWRRTAAAEP